MQSGFNSVLQFLKTLKNGFFAKANEMIPSLTETEKNVVAGVGGQRGHGVGVHLVAHLLQHEYYHQITVNLNYIKTSTKNIPKN